MWDDNESFFRSVHRKGKKRHLAHGIVIAESAIYVSVSG